ncbi:hypothetical protein ACO2RV_03725 [Ancylobacter sp. VNQ12]|uniref:hypothetical protein n=1 Tax=Ancylobacter sp. VNQ12 TaxID=3400920 RepID=UPI003C07AA2F
MKGSIGILGSPVGLTELAFRGVEKIDPPFTIKFSTTDACNQLARVLTCSKSE